jgi:hypothetical protein
MTEDIRVGQSFGLGKHTLMCRSVHERMVRYRPVVHYNHIGPTGGEKRGDLTTYTAAVEDNMDANPP